MNEDLSVNYDKFAEHVNFLAENGCDGIAPNGSLGEYQNLTEAERAKVIEVAVDAAPKGFSVMAGTGAYGAMESLRWAEQAAEAGADCVMQLPPNTFRANHEQVKHHYATVAKAGLPIVGYNNPLDTKVDLIPSLIAEIHEAGHMVGVKEFTGDPRRIYEIQELAPTMDILIGTDDSVLEVGIAGAVGWVAGYPSLSPRQPSSSTSSRPRATFRISSAQRSSTATCTSYFAGTPRPNSSSRSSSRWTHLASTVARAAPAALAPR